MPPKRGSKKGKTSKQSKKTQKEEVNDVDVPMQTEEAEQPSTSVIETAAEIAETTVAAVKEKVEVVVEAAGQFVDEMNMVGVEEEPKEEIKKMTMEERKAKFNELRKRMVCCVTFAIFQLPNMSL